MQSPPIFIWRLETNQQNIYTDKFLNNINLRAVTILSYQDSEKNPKNYTKGGNLTIQYQGTRI